MKYAADIAELSAEAIWCRSFGHGFKPYVPAQKDSDAAGWAAVIVCGHCGTKRFFQWTRRGGKEARGYRYPDYYLAKFPVGPDERVEIQYEALVENGIIPREGKSRGKLRSVKGGKTA